MRPVAQTSLTFTDGELPVDREKAKAFLKEKIDDLFECSFQSGGRKTLNIGFSLSGPFGQYRSIHLEEEIEIGVIPHAKFGLNMSMPWGGSRIIEK